MMTTSSKYCSNKIKQVIEDRTPYFIMKCFISASFEYDRKKAEYYVYWFNENRGIDEESMRYKHLSNKKMGKKEIRFFTNTIDDYELKINSEEGSIWENKKIIFEKDKVINIQFYLNF